MPISIDEMSKIIAVLQETFHQYKCKTPAEFKRRVAAYHLILGDLEPAGLLQAATLISSTNKFFPSTGELRTAYFNRIDAEAGVPDASQAWGEVKALFRRGYSHLRPPTAESVSHPRVLRAIEGVGGWLALCNSTNDTADRARYLQSYETMDKRERETERLPPGVRDVFKRLAAEQRMRLGAGNETH